MSVLCATVDATASENCGLSPSNKMFVKGAPDFVLERCTHIRLVCPRFHMVEILGGGGKPFFPFFCIGREFVLEKYT